MEKKKDICPHCGGTNTVIGEQSDRGAVFRENTVFFLGGTPLLHVICQNCGTVIRSYVKYPGNLT